MSRIEWDAVYNGIVYTSEIDLSFILNCCCCVIIVLQNDRFIILSTTPSSLNNIPRRSIEALLLKERRDTEARVSELVSKVDNANLNMQLMLQAKMNVDAKIGQLVRVFSCVSHHVCCNVSSRLLSFPFINSRTVSTHILSHAFHSS